jgi:hypothetical protein
MVTLPSAGWLDVPILAPATLLERHRVMTESAEGVLPFTVPEATADG